MNRIYRNGSGYDRALTAVSLTTSIWLCLALSVVSSVRIKDMVIPKVVAAGSQSVLLDCDYEYEERDESGLVVKWFWHNPEQHHVYQWIPGQEPQALDVLRDRLNLTYRASDDPLSMHRALNILNPTPELTGSYRCHVSSFEGDEDERNGKMLVYKPVSKLRMSSSKEEENDVNVNISCHAEEVYPKPHLELILFKGRRSKREKVTGGTQIVFEKDNGLFNVLMYRVFNIKELEANNEFHCRVFLPEANYSALEKLQYLPAIETLHHSPSTSGNTRVVGAGVPTATEDGSESRHQCRATILATLLLCYTIYTMTCFV